jgi:2-amino-4-hydroxy-6-hydroxymethyldihydropteridine diphosphokinase
MHNTAYIAMGTNMPHRGVAGTALLRQAVSALRAAGLEVRALSGVWQTAAWPPGVNQPDYYNAVVSLDAGECSPQALYRTLRGIEADFGRERRTRWEARTLDLDIIAMEGFVGAFGTLSLPHARMHERSFVLAPLAEAAPGWRHPELGKTAAQLLAELPAGGGYRRVDDLAPAGGQG